MSAENIIIIVAVLGAATFCIWYPSITSPRHWTREGRHMWAMSASLLALGAVSILRRLIGEWAYYDATVTAIYAAVALLLWQRVLLLYLARREARAKQEETTDA